MATMIPYDRYARALRTWPFDAVESLLDASFSSTAAGFKMNVEDAGNQYVVTAELPGVTRDEIDVELNEGRLSISVEKKESDEVRNKNYLYKETSDWSATRGVYLKDAAVSGLSARLQDGVLTVNVPKQQETSNVTKIAID